MATFQFYFFSAPQLAIAEVDVKDLRELHQVLTQNRFIEARLTDNGLDGSLSNILIATSRIQLIQEMS